MVSFVCDQCQDTIKKPKLEAHAARCRASFTCIDCNVTFYGREWQGHTQCISEEQKYQKGVTNGKGRGGQRGKKTPQRQQATATPSAQPELAAKQPNVPESTTAGNVNVEQPKKASKKEKKRIDAAEFAEIGTEKVKKEKDGKVKKQKKAQDEKDKKEKKERKSKKDRNLDDASLSKESVLSETPVNGAPEDASKKKKKVRSKDEKAGLSEKSPDKKKKRKASEMEDSEIKPKKKKKQKASEMEDNEIKPKKKKNKTETNGEPASLP